MVSHAAETKTKIVCTIGPASHHEGVLRGMIRAGLDVARINCSHGTPTEHEAMIRLVRRLADEESAVVAVMVDLQGPKLRVGSLAEPIELTGGDWLSFTTLPADGTAHVVPLPHPEIIASATVGQRLLLDDGAIEVEIREVRETTMVGQVVVGGRLTSHKGIAAPDGVTRVASLTAKDHEDVVFAVTRGVDFVALSFVQTADDLRELRSLLDDQAHSGRDVRIVAKIESRSAVERFDEILAEADAVMVARGDLGVELPLEEVPLIQKEIIRKCNRAGVPVITATQMLQSMVEQPRPTRAESSDVANAILDGTDAVMLSAETAVGRYPVEVVTTIRQISRVVEDRMRREIEHGPFVDRPHIHPVTDAIGGATARIADEIEAKLIATTTWSGYTARQIARERPRQPIVAFTAQEPVLQQLALVWGVTPVLVPDYRSTDEMIDTVTATLRERGEVVPGDLIVLTGGIPVGGGGKTNFIKVHPI